MNEDRQKIWDEYQGSKPPTIRHNFLDYDRYFEAGLIESAVGDVLEGTDRSWRDLRVLDFGPCAGDYGMYFARLGCAVRFIDIDPDAMDFIHYRLGREHLTNYNLVDTFDLTIYGEVLEHCDDALEILRRDVQNKTEFIFTSSYPYRSDEADDPYWLGRGHSNQARLDQAYCRELLERNYDKLNFEGQRNLWIRK